MDDEGAIVERDWYDVFAGECGFVIPDPRDADIVYGSSENSVGRFDKHNMQLQVISVWPIDASGHAASDLEHRFNWTSPLDHVAVRSGHALLRHGAALPHDRSRQQLAGDQPRSDPQRQVQATGLRRADHQGHHQRRVLRHHLRHRGVAADARA